VVIGFHGTNKKIAETLCRGEKFKPSQNDFDWLGSGIYFWEYAPFRAWEWADQNYAHSPAVVAALIRLGRCFDLLDPQNVRYLLERYEQIIQTQPSLKNEGGANRLDCFVCSDYLRLAESKGIVYDSIRGAFVEARAEEMKSAWPGSGIVKDTHIQLVVRTPENIISVWPVRRDGSYGL